MAGKRTIYQNWIVEMGHEPGFLPEEDRNNPLSAGSLENRAGSEQQLENEVSAAIGLLSPEEREFIIRFHFMGQGYKEISRLSGRAIYKLASIHKRAFKKLKISLAGFVNDRYGLKLSLERNCPICDSDNRDQIEQILASKTEESTWRPIIRKLKDQFDITISTPQLLIGHVRYHNPKPQTAIREAQ